MPHDINRHRAWMLTLAVAGSAAISAVAAPAEPGPRALANACQAPSAAQAVGAPASPDWRALTAQSAWVDERTVRMAPGPAAAADRHAVVQWAVAQGHDLASRFQIAAPLPAGTRVQALFTLEPAARDRLMASQAARATSHLGMGWVMTLGDAFGGDAPALRAFHREVSVLVGLDAQGRVRVAERLQAAQALDASFAPQAERAQLGVQWRPGQPGSVEWNLWAPTAHRVWVCVHGARGQGLKAVLNAERLEESGIWRARHPQDLRGSTYRYLVQVFVPQAGWFINRVTDPYSISLTADSQHSYIGDLDDPDLAPRGWKRHARPAAPAASVDMVISELHVRDFSANDRSVPPALRGKYRAFTRPQSQGMRHLAEMAAAGLTDVHLLPVFDLATVPEVGCLTPDERGLRARAPDSSEQQAAVQATAAQDCYNWGYDPWHFNAPEGSFATDAGDPAVRIRELREMVMALHGLGLRVGMDVVYNHMSAAGQDARSVLDRIVPGYYHRLNLRGEVERSTCCDNTATEHRMMRKLMIDSAVLWVRHHAIDGFRFDLMGHQPREAMEALQKAVNQAAGRFIPLIGEGWNFGEIADGARFVQASQLSLVGSGIATFNDRLRDAARGTRHGDDVSTTVSRKGWLNGAQGRERAEAADLIRAGLAGSLADYRMTRHDGQRLALKDLPYSGQPAGYVSEPNEVVNYVENHDNPTLFDLNAFKLPLSVTALERAQIQVLGSALVALSQGVAYWHAGQEILRSKSMDLNSFDSGDWFNRLDWSLQDNGFGAGLPPGQDSRPFWPVMGPRLVHPGIKPPPPVIAFSKAAHLDLLRLRASTPLLRLPSAQAIRERLSFPVPVQGPNAAVIAMQIDGRGWPGSPHRAVLVVFNSDEQPQRLLFESVRGFGDWELHPVHRAPQAADRRVAAEARLNSASGEVQVPARSAVVWVIP